jgi:two-component system sensor histidine kinase CpxA
MKFRSLYLKFLVSFILLLCITLALLGGWFVTTFWKFLEQEEIDETVKEIRLIQHSILVAVERAPGLPLDQNPYLSVLLQSLDEMYNVMGWIELNDGTVLTGAYNLPLPHPKEIGEPLRFGVGFTASDIEPVGKYCSQGKMEIVLGMHGNATLYALFEQSQLPRESAMLFLNGLVGVFVIVALLIIPISRLISAPVKRLETAALKYAEGDLSARAEEQRRDEIGELGRAFNYMAERIACMIRSTKELAANVSHELRSPLTRLRISEELAREKLERIGCTDVQTYLDNIRAEVDNLDGLIASILEFSRLDLSDIAPVGDSLDLDQMLQTVLNSYKPLLDRKQISLITGFCGQASITGERDEIDSLLVNLIDNAVKYCPEKGRVFVRTFHDARQVRMRITNTFDPIPEAELPKLFTPFYRGRSNGSTGYGLGLPLVRKIAERHGGEVSVSNVEQGVRFSVFFSSSGTQQNNGYA